MLTVVRLAGTSLDFTAAWWVGRFNSKPVFSKRAWYADFLMGTENTLHTLLGSPRFILGIVFKIRRASERHKIWRGQQAANQRVFPPFNFQNL